MSSHFETYKPILDEYARHVSIVRQYYLDMRSGSNAEIVQVAGEIYQKSLNQYTELVQWCKVSPETNQGDTD